MHVGFGHSTKEAKKLNHFIQALQIKWQDKIPDIDVLKKTVMQSII